MISCFTSGGDQGVGVETAGGVPGHEVDEEEVEDHRHLDGEEGHRELAGEVSRVHPQRYLLPRLRPRGLVVSLHGPDPVYGRVAAALAASGEMEGVLNARYETVLRGIWTQDLRYPVDEEARTAVGGKEHATAGIVHDVPPGVVLAKTLMVAKE